MKIKIIPFLYILVTTILLTSCRAKFYTPNQNPVPLFREKGDLYIDASTNFASKGDLTVAYAITDGLGCYGGFGVAKEHAYHTDSGSNGPVEKKYQYYGEMLNLGIGYFVNREQSEKFRFEVFGDLAFGTFRNKVEGTDQQFFNGNYTRVGVMPNFGYTSTDNRLSLAYSIRLSTISFSNTRVSDPGFWRTETNRLNNKSNYGLLEHGFSVRGGFKNIKIQTQFAIYHGLNSDEASDAIPSINFSLMFGLVINTNILRKE